VHDIRDLETVAALKQFHDLSDDWSLATGLSAAVGPNPSRRDAESLVLGADVYLKYRPISQQSPTIVSFQAEALTRRRETTHGILSDSGLYGQVLWKFAERWATAARYDVVSGTANDDLDPDFQLQVTVAEPATLYVMFDTRARTPEWLSRDFADTGVSIGLDTGDTPEEIVKGPGRSIDVQFSVWKRRVEPGTTTLGATNQEHVAHYGIAVVAGHH
jgi:hypothetical protein